MEKIWQGHKRPYFGCRVEFRLKNKSRVMGYFVGTDEDGYRITGHWDNSKDARDMKSFVVNKCNILSANVLPALY